MNRPGRRKFHLLLLAGAGMLALSILAGGLLLYSQNRQAGAIRDAWLQGTAAQTDRLLAAFLEEEWNRQEMEGVLPVSLNEQGSLQDEQGQVYALPPGTEIPQGDSLICCLRGDGVPWFALLERENGQIRGTLVQAQTVYDACMPEEMDCRLLLADATGQVLIYPGADGVGMKLLSDLTESGDPLGRLGQTMIGEAGAWDYSGPDGRMRLWVLPGEDSVNGFLTLGVLTGMPLEGGWIGWLLCGMAAGIGLALILVTLRHRRGREEFLGQLELLERKNAVMEELNRRKQQLAHQQRLEIMGTLTSGIAHEFNNLLVPIMGYSMMALEKLPPEGEVYDDVLEIYNTSRRAGTLIQRLSDLSRKNSDSVFRRLSPRELVERVLKVAKPAQPETVTVQTWLDCSGAAIRGNEVQLSQMLLNLVLNAFHAMPEGGTLTVETACQEGKILFKVADTGTGIAPEVISHIFEPFFSTKDPGVGTGLGLAIVHQVVEDHGGEIDVESRLGVGTTFLVTIPQAPAEPEEQKET